MRPSDALQGKHEIVRAIVARHGAGNVRVFGSALSGSDENDSDLDLLVDVEPETSLLDLVKAQREIEEALGVPVELLTSEDLPETFREEILVRAKPL